MIETFKMVTVIYNTVVSPTMLGRVLHMQQDLTTSDCKKLGQDIIYVNTISLTAVMLVLGLGLGLGLALRPVDGGLGLGLGF